MHIAEKILKEVRKATAELRRLSASANVQELQPILSRILLRLNRLHENAGAPDPRQAALRDIASVMASAWGEAFFPVYADLIGHSASAAPVPDTREARLLAFQRKNACTLADIFKHSALVHKPDFDDWRKGKLSDKSVISARIEAVLSGIRPLKRRRKV